MERFSTFVKGKPESKGSWRAIKGRFIPANPKTKTWQSKVEKNCAELMEGKYQFKDQALSVKLVFFLRRPLGHFGAFGLLKRARKAPSVKPDLDKLSRCVFDALEGTALDNDSRICALNAIKVYVDGDEETGVFIVVDLLSKEEIEEAKTKV